ncbi:MAG: hypothetical protein ACYCT0_07590 [Sulfobacillus sp.]
MSRRLLPSLPLLLLLLAIAGCGQNHPIATSPSAVSSQHAVGSSTAAPSPSPLAVVGAEKPHRIVLTPTRVVSPPNTSQQNETIEAPLIPGTGMDTISVALSSQAVGTLTVTSATHAQLWTLPNTGWVGIAEFGDRHAPVLLARGDQSFCGTGGCVYTGYTYDNATHHFVPVPFNPFGNLAYRLTASHKQWQAIPQESINESSLLGYAGLTSSGLSTIFRLYGPLNGSASQRFHYALDGSPSGEWIPAGPPNFGPDALNGFTTLPATTLQTAATTYLSEVMENHPIAASKLVAPGVNSEAIWSAVRPLTHFGLNGSINLVQYQMVSPTEDVFPLSTTEGSGPQETLITDDAALYGTAVHGGWYVTRVVLKPISVKYKTVSDVLRLLLHNSTVLEWYRNHPQDLARVSTDTTGSTDWLVNISSATSGLAVHVNAVTGHITTSPSSD